MKRRAWTVLIVLSLLAGVVVAMAIDRWYESVERAGDELREAKSELMASAGLLELHNRVYERVGRNAWENQVKPEFLSRITRATVEDSGSWLIDWRDVVRWVRAHPDQTRSMLEECGRLK